MKVITASGIQSSLMKASALSATPTKPTEDVKDSLNTSQDSIDGRLGLVYALHFSI